MKLNRVAKLGFDRFGRLASRFLDSADDVYGGAKSLTRGCFPHQFHHASKRIKKQAGTHTTDLRKETPLDEMVLRTVARIICHASGHSGRVDDTLKIVLEKTLAGRVAAAAVSQQQHRLSICVGLLADAIPIPLH